MSAAEPLATVVVVPRERFSVALRCLGSIYASTPPPFPLIYVDAGSPAPVARALAAEAKARAFELVRVDRFLSPNEARNVGLSRARTRYVVFLDNDVVVAPGWLEALVGCAEESGAELVGPLYGYGEFEEGRVHMTGGTARIHETAGSRRFKESHRFGDSFLREILPELRREPTEMVEFHCMLVRRERLEAMGRLDEGLLSMAEHIDLCMAVRERGGTVYFEPSSRVTYLPPPPLDAADRRYFNLRWSEAWADRSYDHFRKKWRIDADDPYFRENLSFLRSHRRLPLQSAQRAIDRVFGRHSRYPKMALALCEVILNRLLVPRARRPLPAHERSQ